MKIIMIIILVGLVALTSPTTAANRQPTSIATSDNKTSLGSVLCEPCVSQPTIQKAKQLSRPMIKTQHDPQHYDNIYINCSPYPCTSLTTTQYENSINAERNEKEESCLSVLPKVAKDIVPLMQTVLWLAFISVILVVYHKQIYALVETMRKRVESGSGLKVGPVAIEADLHPQSPEQQAKKAEREVVEATTTTTTTPGPVPPDLRARSFQAEDLALRAIQAEYGVPINRQLQAGSDMQLDGVFTKDGAAHIIEVKYSRGTYPSSRVSMMLNHILAGITKYHWRNVKVILAVVYDDSVDLEMEQRRLSEVAKEFEVIVEVRCFSFKYLTKQFGITP